MPGIARLRSETLQALHKLSQHDSMGLVATNHSQTELRLRRASAKPCHAEPGRHPNPVRSEQKQRR